MNLDNDQASSRRSAFGFSSDPEAWRDDALCAQVDVGELFYPERGGSFSARDAKRVCVACPVCAECLSYAIDHDEAFGVWGGLSERERRKFKRGEPIRLLAPCGTVAAFQRHIRDGETPCDPCREAKNCNARQYNAAHVDELRMRRRERRSAS